MNNWNQITRFFNWWINLFAVKPATNLKDSVNLVTINKFYLIFFTLIHPYLVVVDVEITPKLGWECEQIFKMNGGFSLNDDEQPTDQNQ